MACVMTERGRRKRLHLACGYMQAGWQHVWGGVIGDVFGGSWAGSCVAAAHARFSSQRHTVLYRPVPGGQRACHTYVKHFTALRCFVSQLSPLLL